MSKRVRRTKEELAECGYYSWLKEVETLRGKKKSGVKLTPEEKEILRTIPTPEKPFGGVEPKKTAIKPKSQIRFGPEKEFKVGGGAFFCEVRELPFTDEECMLFCPIEDCPFNGKGYFRTKGIRF